MGTLYVVGAPAGDLDDLTFRARRTLRQASLVAAADLPGAYCLLAHHDLEAPVVDASEAERVLSALRTGDVALLIAGERVTLTSAARELVWKAGAQGFLVGAVPGPVMPITALILSGLPADSFLYLGEPPSATACRGLLAAVAHEKRTLVFVPPGGPFSVLLAELYDALGDRPAVLVTALPEGTQVVWRGALAAAGSAPEWIEPHRSALIIGGAPARTYRWDEARLRGEIRDCLGRGLEAKEIGRQLSAKSGWARREIYRLAVEETRSLPLAIATAGKGPE